jgi:endogenous inhibitor of DNA gyrase (YacG/DUF329 family)
MQDCPSCSRPTVRRIAGDWCPFCRGWLIEELDVLSGELVARLWTKAP